MTYSVWHITFPIPVPQKHVLLACWYGFHTEIQRFARQISTFGNAILTFSVCCTQTWLPVFAVLGFNRKASIRLYQTPGCCSQSFSQSHLKHKQKCKEQSNAHCQFRYGIYSISDEAHLEKSRNEGKKYHSCKRKEKKKLLEVPTNLIPCPSHYPNSHSAQQIPSAAQPQMRPSEKTLPSSGDKTRGSTQHLWSATRTQWAISAARLRGQNLPAWALRIWVFRRLL